MKTRNVVWDARLFLESYQSGDENSRWSPQIVEARWPQIVTRLGCITNQNEERRFHYSKHDCLSDHVFLIGYSVGEKINRTIELVSPRSRLVWSLSEVSVYANLFFVGTSHHISHLDLYRFVTVRYQLRNLLVFFHRCSSHKTWKRASRNEKVFRESL